MRVTITGATGLIGGALAESLRSDGHELILPVRSLEKARQQFPQARLVSWEADSGPLTAEALEGVDAVINLAGESIAGGRWTESRKKAIRDSRVLGTRSVVDGISRGKTRPRVLVNGSATGYYGGRGDEIVDEQSRPGTDFLASVCQEWEAEAKRAEGLGVRVVLLRTSMVLSAQGGALPQMLAPFKAFVGGPLGSGRQWMSWIHIDDEVGVIRHAIQQENIRGPVNSTAPGPVTNKEFSKTLGKVLGRPAFMPVPGFAVRLLFGELGDALLLQGQRVASKALQQAGYNFRFAQLEKALRNLLSGQKR